MSDTTEDREALCVDELAALQADIRERALLNGLSLDDLVRLGRKNGTRHVPEPVPEGLRPWILPEA